MIPVRLVIEGLYSYQKRQEIDFNKLTDSYIFGIFGAVGSGKSSILEAITFALYGKTDRLNLSGDNRNYNMMNLKSDSLFIEFVFMVGADSFMARVKGRRNSKKFEEVKALDRQIYKEVDGQWVPIALEAIEKEVGLSYDNFKRTIIIPQGKFKEFLELGNKDRTQMMTELFNLDKFELYHKVTNIESKNNKEKENINGQLQQLGNVSTDYLEELEALFVNIKNILDSLYKDREEIRLKEKDFIHLRDLVIKMEEVSIKLNTLKNQHTDYESLEKQIEGYEYCIIHFKSLLDSIDLSEIKIKSLTVELSTLKEDLGKYEANLIVAKKEYENMKPKYDRRDDLKTKEAELDKIAELILLTNKNTEITVRYNNGKRYILELDNKIKDIKNERLKLEHEIAYQQENLLDIEELSKIRDWFVKHIMFIQRIEECEKKLLPLSKELSNIHKHFFNILGNKLLKGRVDICDSDFEVSPEDNRKLIIETKFYSISEDKEFFNTLIEERNKALEFLDKEISKCNVEKRLEQYAESLKDGSMCPLCGATEHPSVFTIDKIEVKLKDYEAKRGVIKEEISDIKNFVNIINEEKIKHSHLYNRNWEIVDELQEIIKAKEVHTTKYHWKEYKNIDEVEKMQEHYYSSKKKLNSDEAHLKLINTNIEKESLNLEKYKLELDKIQSDKVENQTKIETLQSQIKLLSLEQYSTKVKQEIMEEKKDCINQYLQLEERFNIINKDISLLETNIAEIKGKYNVNAKLFEEENILLQRLRGSFTEKMQNSSYTSKGHIVEIIKCSFNLEESKSKLRQYKEMYHLYEKTYTELEKQINNRVYNKEQHNILVESLKNIELDIEKNNRELGSTEALINKIKKELEQKKYLEAKLAKLLLREEDIKTMKQLFKGSGFVNYVSSVHLQNLCKLANERFYKLTKQTLKLEITDDNNFQIRDYLNGGKLRNVKTLSGGQTFQASLSLALALADSIQKFTNSSQNFFFLDEGFGSLDKDALRIVFDTLKALRKENRVIGVISHVEDMQQEIEVFVKVRNSADLGSIIEFNWS